MLFDDDWFELDELDEVWDGRDLFGLEILEEEDDGLGALTAGLWLVTGAFFSVPPPFGLGLLSWPNAEREMDSWIKSSNVFIRAFFNG